MASSPWYGSSVTTMATGSPTYRTVSLASMVCVMCVFHVGSIGLIALRPSRSAAVYTATTPGAAFAAAVSMPVIRPCATGDRTKNTWQAPASRSSWTSSV